MTPKTMMMSLWDLLVPPPPKPKQIKKPTKPRPIQAKYDAIVEQMKNTYGFRIRKWRTSMSGLHLIVFTEGALCKRAFDE